MGIKAKIAGLTAVFIACVFLLFVVSGQLIMNNVQWFLMICLACIAGGLYRKGNEKHKILAWSIFWTGLISLACGVLFLAFIIMYGIAGGC